MAAKKKITKTKPAYAKPTAAIREETNFMVPAVVLSITLAVFLPALSNGFVNWDDAFNIYENKNIEQFDWQHIKSIFTDPVIGGYNPLPIFTFAVEHALVGLKPFLYHFDNLLLHLICTLFVYLILRRLNLSPMAAGFATLLFGIHPMRVESVAWATERKDVLYGAFYLGALYTYILSLQSTESRKKYYWITMGLFVLALFSKIQAVSLPLSMLAVDYLLQRPLKWNLILEKIPFFLASLIIGFVGIYFLATNNTLSNAPGLSLPERALIGTYSLSVYLMKLIVPYELCPLYPYPSALDWHFYISPLGVLAFLALLVWAYLKNKREIVFGLIFFLVNVVFLLQVVGAGQGFIADRFTYIPYIGLFFLLAFAYQTIANKSTNARSYTRIAGIVFLSVLGVMTIRQIGIWKDPVALWSHVLKYYPNATTPWSNRAEHYRKNNDYANALADYNRAIGLKPNPTDLNARGLVFFQTNEPEKALADYTLAYSLDSTKDKKMISEILANRAAVYGKFKRFPEAVADASHALELDSANVLGHRNRYLAYIDLGQYDKALADAEAYIKLKTSDPDGYFDRGSLLHVLGRDEEAVESFNTAIRMADPARPNLGLFYFERAKAYLKLGKKAESQADAQEAERRGMQIPPELR